jgi:hypothetical protein
MPAKMSTTTGVNTKIPTGAKAPAFHPRLHARVLLVAHRLAGELLHLLDLHVQRRLTAPLGELRQAGRQRDHRHHRNRMRAGRGF